MTIREYRAGGCAEIATLFYNTVHTINAQDYTKTQLDAWATGSIDLAAWHQAFSEHHTLVAQENNTIVGFGDMDDKGYLDRLYVHKEYQGKGFATTIVKGLEQHAVLCGVFCFQPARLSRQNRFLNSKAILRFAKIVLYAMACSL